MTETIDMRKHAEGTRLLLRGGQKATKLKEFSGSFDFPHLIQVDGHRSTQCVMDDGAWRGMYPHEFDVMEVLSPELEWETMALECLAALRLFNRHYEDLSKSNPGFLGKLCLQDYGLLNEALIASDLALCRYKDVKTPKEEE